MMKPTASRGTAMDTLYSCCCGGWLRSGGRDRVADEAGDKVGLLAMDVVMLLGVGDLDLEGREEGGCGTLEGGGGEI